MPLSNSYLDNLPYVLCMILISVLCYWIYALGIIMHVFGMILLAALFLLFYVVIQFFMVLRSGARG